MIIGRDGQAAAIEAALSGAAHGCPSTVLVTGDPGMGKTSLLELAKADLADCTVFACSPIEAEREIPFAGLHQLLLPALSLLGRIPNVQAEALRSALAVSTSQGEAPLAIGAAVLSVLTVAAAERPVVCLLDDAQWLDVQSRSALQFATRRLTDERIAFVVTSEESGDEWPSSATSSQFVHIHLAGIEFDEARGLVERQYPDIDASVASAIVRAANGNPQALLDSPALLTDEQRQGKAPLPQPIPVATGLPHSVRTKVDELSEPARSALLYASVAGTGAYRVVVACDDSSVVGMAEVEDAGLVSLSEGTFEFAHRLTPSGVYQSATPEQRREAHRRMAVALKGNDRYRERRAWHLAAAAAEPDEALSAELADAADKTTATRGHGAASSLFETAARLSETPDRRNNLIGSAARSAWLAGEPRRATELLGRLEGETAQAAVLGLRSQLEIQQGTLIPTTAREPAAHLAQAADKQIDASGLEGLLPLLVAAHLAEPPMALEYAARAVRESPGPPAEAVARLSLARAMWLSGRFDDAKDAQEVPRHAQWIGASLADELLFEVLTALSEANPADTFSLTATQQLLDQARRTTTVALPAGHLATGHGHFAQGDWRHALNEYVNAESVALETDQWETLARVRASIDMVRVLRGGRPEASQSDQSERVAVPPQVMTALTVAAHFVQGRDDHVLKVWTESALTPESWTTVRRWLPPRSLSPVDLIEAATKVGGHEKGAEAFSHFESALTPREQVWAQAVVAEDYEGSLTSLLEDHFDDGAAAYERARVLLLLGARMRRSAQSGACRDPLRRAMKLFAQLPAKEWANRAKRELAATGITVHAAPMADSEELTSQELQVAQVVAGGSTYREAAAELFLSPKTIEFHLSKVYRKLGIASRRELAGRLAAPEDSE